MGTQDYFSFLIFCCENFFYLRLKKVQPKVHGDIEIRTEGQLDKDLRGQMMRKSLFYDRTKRI